MSSRLVRHLFPVAGGVAFALLIGWLATARGPLAPVRVTVATVELAPLVASTFGIGTIEARRSYAIGPTVASRVARVLVDQGDEVRQGQLLAELDPVDLVDRVTSGQLAAERAASAMRTAEALLAEAQSRARLAESSARRSAELRAQGFVSQEATEAKRHEANAAASAVDAAASQLAAAGRDHERALADSAAVGKLRAQTRLSSPVAAVVSARLVEPGTTVVAGQAVVQVIDPSSLWIRARIDQGQAGGVRVGQSAEIVLRSDPRRSHRGAVQRLDWVSDSVTEERIVNIGFAEAPSGIAVGELVEVTIRTSERPAVPSVPTAAIKRRGRQQGVWQLVDGRTAFRPVAVGIATLDGRSEILDGLQVGDHVVVHSDRVLEADTRAKIVSAIVLPES